MRKKTKMILVIAAAVILISVIAWFVFRKPKTDPLPLNTGTGTGTGSATNTGSASVTPSNTGVTGIYNDDFPLQVGSQGPRVRSLQSKLNRIQKVVKVNESGTFDAQTRIALITGVGTKYDPPLDASAYIEIFNKPDL